MLQQAVLRHARVGGSQLALAPTALQFLIDAARSDEELFDLLRLAGCLTPRGRANRSTVVVLMTRIRDAYEPPFRAGQELPGSSHGCPTVWDSIEESLSRAGYLQLAAWPDTHRRISSSDVEKRVEKIISDARASQGGPPDSDTPWLQALAEGQRQRRREAFEIGPIPCPECRRDLPDGVLACVWCGADLPFICSCRP